MLGIGAEPSTCFGASVISGPLCAAWPWGSTNMVRGAACQGCSHREGAVAHGGLGLLAGAALAPQLVTPAFLSTGSPTHAGRVGKPLRPGWPPAGGHSPFGTAGAVALKPSGLSLA